MILDQRSIEFILANDVERTRAEFDSAKAHIPWPDGTHRVENAGTAFRVAMAAYGTALCEFNDFMFAGTVPDRLKGPEQERTDTLRQNDPLAAVHLIYRNE